MHLLTVNKDRQGEDEMRKATAKRVLMLVSMTVAMLMVNASVALARIPPTRLPSL